MREQMKVLHVIPSLGYGGAEKLLVDLLPTLLKHGVDSSVVTLSNRIPLAPGLVEAGIPVTSLGVTGTIYQIPRLLRAVAKLRVEMARAMPDIIHSHLFMADLCTRLARGVKGPVLITTLHNVDPWWFERRRLRSRLKTWLDGFLAYFFDVYFLAVSQDVKYSAQKALGLRDGKVRVVYNGIKIEAFQPRAEIHSHRGPVIIQVGRFYKQKGHAVAVRAFSVLKKTYPDAKLLFVGDRPLRPKIEEMVKCFRLERDVTFLGTRADVPELLAESDIFWMPSEYDGLPIACIEAMASGLPVVATDVPGIREVVLDGITGHLVPPRSVDILAAKTIEILGDPNMWRHMSSNERHRAEREFSIEANAEAYSQAYRDALEGLW